MVSRYAWYWQIPSKTYNINTTFHNFNNTTQLDSELNVMIILIRYGWSICEFDKTWTLSYILYNLSYKRNAIIKCIMRIMITSREWSEVYDDCHVLNEEAQGERNAPLYPTHSQPARLTSRPPSPHRLPSPRSEHPDRQIAPKWTALRKGHVIYWKNVHMHAATRRVVGVQFYKWTQRMFHYFIKIAISLLSPTRAAVAQ